MKQFSSLTFLILTFLTGFSQNYSAFIKEYKKAYDSLRKESYWEVNYLLDSISKVCRISKDSLKIKHIAIISYRKDVKCPIKPYTDLETPVDSPKYIDCLNPRKIKFGDIYVFDKKKKIAVIRDFSQCWGRDLRLFFYKINTDTVTNYNFLDFLNYLDIQGIDTIFMVDNAIYIYFAIKNDELYVITENKNEKNEYEYKIYKAEEYLPNNIKKHIFYTCEPTAIFSECPPEDSKLKKFIKRIIGSILSLFRKGKC